jgi:hypothetical protein
VGTFGVNLGRIEFQNSLGPHTLNSSVINLMLRPPLWKYYQTISQQKLEYIRSDAYLKNQCENPLVVPIPPRKINYLRYIVNVQIRTINGRLIPHDNTQGWVR